MTRAFALKNLRIVSLAVAALCFCHNLGAQTHYRANVAIGAKAGADMSRVFFNPSVPQGFIFGGVAGFTFRYVEESHFGLIAELNWTQRGWKENFEGAPYRYSRTLNYIQIPVMAHIYFGRRGRFFFNAGPEIGFFIGDKVSADFDPYNTAGLPDFPNTNRTNTQMSMKVNQKIDYGISAGLGGEFSINRRNALYVEARFYYGLGNVLKSGRTEAFNASNQMSVSLCLGYWLRLH